MNKLFVCSKNLKETFDRQHILRQLGIDADYLLLDPYYDCDCATWIASEIGTIIEMLKKEEEKRK